MPSLSRTLAYVLAGIPAAIGTTFVARYAFVTSDTAIDGASNAFLFGMIAAGAFGGSAVAVALASNGRKLAAGIFGVLAVLAMATNWSHTLGAIAHRGAGTEAERVKAKADENDNRATLKRLEAERGAMTFVPATTEAVEAAREAVRAAERTRIAECESRGRLCRSREADEQTARLALSTTLTNRAATETAADHDRQIAALRTGLAKAPAVKEGNSLGTALGRILHLSAATAASFQQGLVSAIVELLIAATLALPELLKRTPPAKSEDAPEEPVTAAKPANVVAFIQPFQPGSVDRFMLACVSRAKGSNVSWVELYSRYRRWCAEQEPSLAAIPAQLFGKRLDALRADGVLRAKVRGDEVYCLDVTLVA